MKRTILIPMTCLAGLLAYWALQGSSSWRDQRERDLAQIKHSSNSAQGDVLSRKGHARLRPAELLKGILNNNIVFYGRVVDEEGVGIAGAKIRYSTLDSAGFANVWTEAVPKKEKYADSEGRFEIAGKGGSLNIYVSNEGYYTIPGESKGGFSYGMPSGDRPSTDPKNPVTFRLRKKGETEPLYYFDGPTPGHSWIRIGDGRTLYLDPRTGQVTEAAIPVGIAISQTNNRPPRKDTNWDPRQYDWKATLNIPRGGFVEREGRFDFEAPLSGYREKVTIGMAKDDENWKRTLENEYFVKYPNGTFGRLQIRINTSKFIYQSHWNPSGSRNLEYDPEKLIKPER